MIQELFEFALKRYNIIAYLVALILSIRYYGKYFDTALKYFPMIIAYTLFNELLGYFVRNYDDFAFFSDNISANDLIYNFYDLVIYSYFYFLYWRLVDNKVARKWIKILSISVLISYIISSFYQNPLKMSLFYATCYGSLIIAICVIFYFANRIKSGGWNWNWEKYNLMTWVSIGLFVFYLLFPIIYLIGFLRYDLWQKFNLQTTLLILITCMYISFSIGFLKSSRRFFR
ncbi:hypothetical protein [Croceivirga thetidis]|uniref:Uncharacterized protein n=1 Tax=Croceivirga thetidis TaxID=2721623 RepID=A0ABX1GVP2_9FLAO|nr:hypothetical protein [Croceivirga thetidis]NKI33081.1 hypothetical protein [Croceivirga thetidis]